MSFNTSARGLDALGSPDDLHRPRVDEYERWLSIAWKGDRRELHRGRFLQQQRDLQFAFQRSHFLASIEKQVQVRVTQLTHDPGFPEPAARLRRGAVWNADDIVSWAAKHRHSPEA